MQILSAQNQNKVASADPAAAPAADLANQKVDLGPARGGQIFVQVGAFSQYENAHKLAARLSLIGPVGVSSTFVNKQEFFRVRLGRSEEHTSELQSLMRISYAVFCLKKNTE